MGFEPNSVVRIDQLSQANGIGKSTARQIGVAVGGDGAFSTSVDLTYDMGGGVYCDHNPTLPGNPRTCELWVSYTQVGTGIAVKTPLHFGGPPIAVLVPTPSDGVAPLDVQFTSQSTDLDRGGYITNFEFDFGDGSPVFSSPTQAGLVHTYAAPGQYTASLTVTDIDGDQATDTKVITVTGPTNTPPYAYIYPQYLASAGVGDEVQFYFYGNDQEG